jgi:hypothetical protein
MTKRLVAKIDTYQKDGQEKGKYIEIGVILSNDNGEYALINPEVNLAGVLLKQRVNLPNKGKGKGDMIICSIFDNDRNQQGGQQQSQAGQGDNFDDFDKDPIPF